MSAHINENVLNNFLSHTLNINKLTRSEALKYDIETDDFKEANVDKNNYLEIDEILDNKDLYAQFATLFVEEQEKDKAEQDKEKEKEKAERVQGTGADATMA